MKLLLYVFGEDPEMVKVEAEIDNFDLIDTTEYRQALFDATIEQMKDALIREGVL